MGSCCYNTQPFNNNNNNGFNSNFQNQGFSSQNTGRCQCDYSLTFRDQNTHTGHAGGATTRGGPGATPPVGTTTAATFRGPTDSKTTPGRTGRAAIKADQELWGAVVFKQ